MGHSRFEQRARGCALIEHWRGIRGGEGTGLMHYDTKKAVWLRYYVAGGLIEDGIEGRKVENGIQFQDATARFRYQKTPNGATLWESSPEGEEARTMTRLAAPGSFAASPDTVAACAAPEFREFDFWLGEWTVTNQGKTGGKSRIERASKGCLLLENWTGADGGEGVSFNFYDPKAKRWQQRWVMGPSALRLEGNYVNGVMRLSDSANAIEWTAMGSEVRQVWTRAGANGAKVLFDGVYRR
jgi:hypothetical protein